jgi:peroxiredoxin family protein
LSAIFKTGVGMTIKCSNRAVVKSALVQLVGERRHALPVLTLTQACSACKVTVAVHATFCAETEFRKVTNFKALNIRGAVASQQHQQRANIFRTAVSTVS